MKVEVIGGGPAGLYSAILLKKSFPAADVKVLERNQADDTFGFGIVLSDETLGNLEKADGPSHEQIKANFAYWDDILVQYKGDVLRSGGHGFSGLGRLAMLQILQARAKELNIPVLYGVEGEAPAEHSKSDADLIIACDGINSAVREAHVDHFAPETDLRTNRFVWLGAKMTLPGFYYSFREHAGGIWNMHAYQYRQGECTIVIETTDEAFKASGLAEDDEQSTAKLIEQVFADDLNGAQVLTNRSHWRQFPTIHCKTWHRRLGSASVVLLGDAAHTAHFSIGSGTKLALEDAISLHDAIVQHADKHDGDPVADLEGAMQAYEETRRNEVGRIQHSAEVSLVWFENVRRFWKMSPTQFNASVLTRSKQITYENLRMRDAALVDEITRWWNADQAERLRMKPRLPAGAEGDKDAWLDTPPMFAPFKLRELTLQNRVVVSPMAQYMATDGVPDDWHLTHYGSRALGGAGLIFTEMTCPSADARITPGCTGLWNDDQMHGFKRITNFVHQHSDAKICLQLGHAGRKGSTQLGWHQMDYPLQEPEQGVNWPLVSASPIAFREGVNQVPREMNRADMDQVIADFVQAAQLGEQAGFDMLELHMAHGYLLASFLSPVTNERTDEYGGGLDARMKFPLEVFDAVRNVWPENKPMSCRLSATDWIEGGQTPADSTRVAQMLKDRGCDLIDVSSGQTDPESKPVYGRMFQATFAEQIRLEVGVPTMAVGAITSADQVNTLLVSGRADLVALARPHLANPNFTLHSAAKMDWRGQRWPKPYEAGAFQLHVLEQREKQDLERKLEQARQG